MFAVDPILDVWIDYFAPATCAQSVKQKYRGKRYLRAEATTPAQDAPSRAKRSLNVWMSGSQRFVRETDIEGIERMTDLQT